MRDKENKNETQTKGTEMETKRTEKEVNETFDALTGESYYGFNMRMQMYNLSDEEFQVLRNFAEICRLKRKH